MTVLAFGPVEVMERDSLWAGRSDRFDERRYTEMPAALRKNRLEKVRCQD